MRRALSITSVLLATLALTACTGGASVSPSSAAPSLAPSTAASASAASVAPSASADACAKDALTTKTSGKLTIGTDNPAYPPYFDIPEGGATKPPRSPSRHRF